SRNQLPAETYTICQEGHMKPISRTLGCLLDLSWVAVCQPAKPMFEAADVHTTASTSDDFSFLVNGRLEARGVTMLRLISSAYSVANTMVVGGPSWLDTDRFDVIAKAQSSGASQMNMRNMLQNLLADRFHLEIKNDKQPLPAFVLTLAKKGVVKPSTGAGDPNCKRTVEDSVISLTC